MRLLSLSLALLILPAVSGSPATAQSVAVHSPTSTQVVFVCEHGSVRSLVAMEYFNRRSHQRGLPYRAVARGVAPEASVPASVRAGLQTDGFDVSTFVPRRLIPADVDGVLLVVSFDQDLTTIVGGRSRYLKWDDLPFADYPRGRDAIARQVDALIDTLARNGSP